MSILRFTRLVCAASLALLLAACMPGPPPPQPEPEPTTTPPARQSTVIDTQLQALDRAKGVEAQVLDQAKRAGDEGDEGDQAPR